MDDAWDCHVHVFDAAAPARHGHYQPADAGLAEIERIAAANGVSRLVLVQPSVYGSDNTVMLRALRASDGRHRGVAVASSAIADDQLHAMHEAGVRAVRFNLVSPVGTTRADAPAELMALAPRLRALGWHVQWYAHWRDADVLAQWQKMSGLPFVLDHLAGLTADPAVLRWARPFLAQLAGAGGWIKCSGWYRLEAKAPYAGLVPVLREAEKLFGPRMVWGSDWPHTSFTTREARPAYDGEWAPVLQAFGETRAAAIRAAGGTLYA